MNLPLFLPSSNSNSLLCFVAILLVKFLPSSADTELFRSCSLLFHCGNITAGFPFWGGDRLQLCGHPHLELKCENGTPTMMIGDVKYRVFNVDSKKNALKIARQDYLDGLCPEKDNTVIRTLFYFSDGYENLGLTYGCSKFPGNFTCRMKDVINYTDGFIQFKDGIASSNCNTSVNVIVSTSLFASAKRNKTGLEEALKGGFQVTSKFLGCDENCSSCGFDDVSDRGICYCPNGQPGSSTVCSTSTKGPSSYKTRNIYIGIAAGVVGITAVLAIFFVAIGRFLKRKRENVGRSQNVEAFIRSNRYLDPKRYNYSDVKWMTKSFHYKLGQGGYGDVYKGKLPDGRPVAVKILKNFKGNSGDDFINEVASISRTSHVNIVTLLGFCYEKKKRALIYEFMPNGSLDQFICDQESSNTKRKLECRTMYQIAVGVARGLEYLYRGCNVRIVHLDIKPHNILLDEDFCPKISDFGLSKQSKKKESIISMVDTRGTVGYIAPEVFCRSVGGVSHKSDVYSYGMMILEMVVGRKNADDEGSRSSEIYFPDYIYKRMELGNDFQLDGVDREEEKEMVKKMILVSLWCIQTNPSDRPSIIKVVEMLEGGIENLQIPPKPSMSSPKKSAKSSSPTSLATELASQEESCIE